MAGLETAGVDISGIKQTQLPTGTAATSVDTQGENAIIVAPGANSEVSHKQLDELLSRDTTLLLQGEIPLAEMTLAIQHVKTAGAKVIWNLAPMPDAPIESLTAVDVVLVNESELFALGQLLGIIQSATDFSATAKSAIQALTESRRVTKHAPNCERGQLRNKGQTSPAPLRFDPTGTQPMNVGLLWRHRPRLQVLEASIVWPFLFDLFLFDLCLFGLLLLGA